MADVGKMSLRDLFYVLFKHKNRMALIVFTAIFGACIYVFVIATPSYEATTKILVKIGREKFSALDVSSRENPNVLFQEREQNIANEIEILKDPYLTGLVLPRLQERLERIPPAAPPPEGWFRRAAYELRRGVGTVAGWLADGVQWAMEPLYRFGLLSRTPPEEVLFRKLRDALDVSPIKATDVILVNFSWRDPEFAAFAANTYVSEYQQQHVRVHESEDASSFYEQQLARAQADLEAVERELGVFVDRKEGNTIQFEKQVKLEVVSDLEAKINEAAVELGGVNLKLSAIEQAFKSNRGWIETPDASQKIAGTEALDQAFVTLVGQRNLLLERFTPRSREIREINDQIAALRSQKHQSLRNYYRIRRDTIENQLAALRRKLAEEQTALPALFERNLRYEELEMRRNLVLQTMSNYKRKLEELRVNEALNARDVSSARVISPAQPPLRPAHPRTPLILVLAAAFGVFAAIAYAVISEFFGDTFRTERDVSRVLGLPLVATVPELPGEANA